jgi:hypothetical protein
VVFSKKGRGEVMTKKEGSVRWLFLAGLVLVCLFVLSIVLRKRENISQETAVISHLESSIDIDKTYSSKSTEPVLHSLMDEKSTSSGVLTKDVSNEKELNFIDDEILKQSKSKASFAFFKSEYGDPRKFVTLKWHDGMSYDLTCRLITKDKLPMLYQMLNDKDYAPYWHNVARVIGYISNDSNSVPVLLSYFQRDDGSEVSSLVGKIWSIALIGKIGGDKQSCSALDLLFNKFK